MTMPNPMGTYAGVTTANPTQHRYLTITSADSHTGDVTALYHDGARANPISGTYKFANAEKGGQARLDLASPPGEQTSYKFVLVSNPVDISTPFNTLSGDYWLNGASHRIDLKRTY
ncbi:hypothetical protein [Pseudomonas sp. AM4(2022)]|uniref:hypothetical protein n=1 Tax=Pseudomonas sp. AM4(2022) TaxID=2983408 RepID=UPI002E8049F9|nr:hypothetical protein [Pseudomonas sp. AM4(2022)]